MNIIIIEVVCPTYVYSLVSIKRVLCNTHSLCVFMYGLHREFLFANKCHQYIFVSYVYIL